MRVNSSRYISLAASVVLCAVVGCAPSDSDQIVGNSQVANDLREKLLAGTSEDGENSVSTAERTGWASLSGTFIVDGQPPADEILKITSDPAVCKPGGAPVYAKQIEVGPDKGLANVVIFVRTKMPDDWLHEDAKNPPEEPLIYDQKDCVFLSHVTAVNANRKMLFKNSDPIGHNSNIASFDNFNVPKNGGVVDFSFKGRTKNLPVKVKCNIHDWMLAWIIPLGNNYFDVTGKDGKFEIKNLPTGVPLEFQVWQEVTGGLDGVSITNPKVKWKRGRFTVTLDKDTDEVLDVVVPAKVFN